MKYRTLGPNDNLLIEKLIAIDPDHATTSTVDFWTSEIPQKTQSFAVEDDKGTVFYCKVEKVARIHIQFDSREKFRTAKALVKFIPSMEKILGKDFTQVIWESTSPKLIAFFEQFGYRHSKNEIIKDL